MDPDSLKTGLNEKLALWQSSSVFYQNIVDVLFGVREEIIIIGDPNIFTWDPNIIKHCILSLFHIRPIIYGVSNDNIGSPIKWGLRWVSDDDDFFPDSFICSLHRLIVTRVYPVTICYQVYSGGYWLHNGRISVTRRLGIYNWYWFFY